MRFAVLGPLEVRTQAGDVVGLARRKARVLLALLLLRNNRFVATEQIIDDLWGERPPASARANLQSYVADVRRLLGDNAWRLEWGDGGYRIRADEPEIDVLVFDKLAREGRDELQAGRAGRALTLLTRALGLWRGRHVAEGLPLPLELDADVARLTEARLAAAEDQIDARLELGQHRDIEPDVLPLLGEHPYRERLWGQLMVTRYRSGRQADALSAYRQVRRRLGDDLGIRPCPELEALHERILRSDPQLDLADDAADVRMPEQPIPRQLPAQRGLLVGRVAEQAKIVELAAAGKTVVIDGMGGVGKTTLAVHAAHRLGPDYPDGQIFVDLGGFAPGGKPVEPAEALVEVLGALGRIGGQLPSTLAGRAALWRTIAAERRILLVLDNASSEAQVEPLIPAAAGCCVIVTSRRRLPGLAHHPVSLDIIGDSDGVALLTAIVGADRMESAVAAEVHALCGGLPLAIEVAGSRMRARTAWTSETLRARLECAHSRLTELTAGERSVTAAFQLSYGQLDDSVRRTFRLLSLHPGADIGADAAAALVGSDLATIDRNLERLVDDHLLRQDTAGRYRFHDLLREFAVELVTETDSPGRRVDAVQRLAQWYLHAACEAVRAMGVESSFHPPVPFGPAPDHLPDFTDDESAVRWLESEWRNLVAVVRLAASHEMHAHASRIAFALFGFFLLRGHNEQFIAVNEVGLASARALGDRRAEAETSNALGVAFGRSARYAEALDVMGTALKLYQDLGDEQRMASALSNLGIALWHRGRSPEAVDHLRQALATARRLDNVSLVSVVLNNLGELYRRLGWHTTAREHLEEALSLLDHPKQPRRTATTLTGLGATMAALGQPERARDLLLRARDLANRAGHREGEGTAVYELGILDANLNATTRAVSHHQQALAIGREIGDAMLESQALNGLGEAFRERGEHERALECHRRALDVVERVGDPIERARADAGIGRALAAGGDTARARDHIARAVDLVQGLELPESDELRHMLVELNT